MKHLFVTMIFTTLAFAVSAQLLEQQDPATGLKGMLNRNTGAVVIPVQFTGIQMFFWQDSMIVVDDDGWRGVYSPSGKILVPVKFREIRPFKYSEGYAPGYVMVTTEAPGKRMFGLYRLGEGLVLPEKFETAAPVFSDLLAARVLGDTILQFFSAEGKPLFNLPGMRVKSTVAGKVMEIEKRNHSSWFLYKSGKPVLPESIKQPRWTDGKFVISGQDGKVGLLTLEGDTVMPCKQFQLLALDPNRFVVAPDSRTAGLIDGRGAWIIPPASQTLFTTCPDTQCVIVSRSFKDFGDKLYDRNGKLLLSGIQFIQQHAEESLLGVVPDQVPNDYFWVKLKDGQKVGMYRDNGRLVVPAEYQSVQYGSEHHVVLAQTFKQPSDQKERYMAYNLEGQVVLKPTYTYLRFTRDPKLLIGVSEKSDLAGFIRVDKPNEAKYEYQGITDLYANHYAGKTPIGFVLLDPAGNRLGKEMFISLEHPKFKHIMVYDEHHSDILVAIGTRNGTAKGVWYALNNKGEAFEFPPLHEEPNEETEVVAEIEELIETPRQPDFSNATGQGRGPAYETMVEKGDTHPAFPGGEPALLKFLNDNLRYPERARESHVEGYVMLTFVVETDGSISNPMIIKDIGAGCGYEALRLVGAMPKWQPGTTGGKPIRAKFTLPVEFKLK